MGPFPEVVAGDIQREFKSLEHHTSDDMGQLAGSVQSDVVQEGTEVRV
jgi:hypothetical protein